MRKISFLLLLLLGCSIAVFAQDKFTISGYMKDASTGEELIGSTVYIEQLAAGTSTNVYGFYSLTVAKGEYTLRFNYVGYQAVVKKIVLDKNITLNIELAPATQALEEVEITTERQDQNVTSTEMSTITLNVKEMKTLPVLFGEADIMKTIELMPGVMSGGEGSTGLYVRGGGPDQNLILLDEAPVYNASHLLGFFSVFNSDAIKDVKLYKGGIPAEYGGRISSVLDVKMNEGNSKKYSASGGLGLIASRLTIEGPIVKDKGSFIVSGRRTYADLFLKASRDTNLRKSRLFFYDLNLKSNYRLGEKDRLFLSGYFGQDVFGFSDQFGFHWGNATGTLRWNHLFSPKLFLNTTAVFSNYQYVFDIGLGETNIKLLSGLQDYNLKMDFSYFPNAKNSVKYGVNTMLHRFFPPSFEANIDGTERKFKIPERYAVESAGYISNEQTITDKLSANYGIRYSIFNAIGPGEHYVLDEALEKVIDTVNYSTGEIYETYHGIEPRLAVTYLLGKTSSVKASYNRTRQYIHLLSNSASSNPTDLWIPSGAYVKPQIGDQVAAGYFRNFKENMYEASAEIYYKYMQNQIDYKNGANITFNPTIETELLFGKGRAYGLELFLQKKQGKFTGWIGYTLSRSEREIEGVDNGDPYPVRYDRTHDVSVVGTYKLGKRWVFSGTWVYSTGNAVTFPVGKYEYNGHVVSYYTERNGYRMPPYHRMDLSATLEGKKDKKFDSSWNFAIYNVYARKNPYSISFRQSESDPAKTEAVQLSLFTLIPSITWNFKF